MSFVAPSLSFVDDTLPTQLRKKKDLTNHFCSHIFDCLQRLLAEDEPRAEFLEQFVGVVRDFDRRSTLRACVGLLDALKAVAVAVGDAGDGFGEDGQTCEAGEGSLGGLLVDDQLGDGGLQLGFAPGKLGQVGRRQARLVQHRFQLRRAVLRGQKRLARGGGGAFSLRQSRRQKFVHLPNNAEPANWPNSISFLYQYTCALVTGVFGGSILMPLQLAPSKYQGLSFVPSFGLGTLIVAPLITLPYMWLSRSSGSRGNWAVRQSLIPGLLAGTVWNGANVASIFAIKAVGYAVAYPLMQCAIAVAALWGVLVFKEIRGRQIGVMAASAVVVLGGAVLLAVSKK